MTDEGVAITILVAIFAIVGRSDVLALAPLVRARAIFLVRGDHQTRPFVDALPRTAATGQIQRPLTSGFERIRAQG